MKILRQASLYSLIGVANTAVTMGIIYVAKHIGGLDDVAANACGYAVGIAQSFFLNAKYTFSYSGSRLRASIRFLTIMGAGYLLNLMTVIACIHLFAVNSDLSHLFGVVPYTMFTFLASKYWAFPERSERTLHES